MFWPGVYLTGPLQIEFGWKNGEGTLRTHSVDVPAGTSEKSFTVPTGPAVVDEFVRLSAPAI